jgi:chromosome partitioning protein
MLTIGVLNSKGGAGKTTVTANLAVRASRDAMTAVVDLDPQSSYSDWYKRRGSPDNPALLLGEDRASDAVEALRQTSPYDYIFVDGPTNAILVTEDAVKASDFVIIPMRASGLDLAASSDCISLCQDLNKPFCVVVNDMGRGDAGLLKQTQGVLFDWKVPIAKTVIAHRVSYVNAMSIGKVGAEKDKAAAEEIDNLWAEITHEIAKHIKATQRKTKVRA